MKTKRIHKDTFESELSLIKRNQKKVVFTNGCFDIIHAGHVRYLKHAKSLGDILIIGINSDSSVSRFCCLNCNLC